MSHFSENAQKLLHGVMALCLGVMATVVFVNVVLRYGFGTGIAASEELSRLLFVWTVFVGATSAYPKGELMTFTLLLSVLKDNKRWLTVLTVLIRLLVILASVLVAIGAWQQVVVGMGSHSVVLRYPIALLPLPAFLSTTAIAVMALVELVRGTPIFTGHTAEVE